MCALQASLDILRKHRPDYTPRTGFVWPITDSSITIDNEVDKTRESEGPTQQQDQGVLDRDDISDPMSISPDDRREVGTTPKRQKNTMLLMNAMKTTAIHSKISFTQIQSQQTTRETTDRQDSGTPVTAILRSSATPAPSGPQTTGILQESSQEGAKGPSGAGGGGRKKKKRWFIRFFFLGIESDLFI